MLNRRIYKDDKLLKSVCYILKEDCFNLNFILKVLKILKHGLNIIDIGYLFN